MSWRVAAGLVFFAAQAAYLWPSTWAPFHEHAVYRLRTELGGRVLDTAESLEHFHLSKVHFSAERDENWETNSLDFVVRVIESAPPGARVELTGTRDGVPFSRVVQSGARR